MAKEISVAAILGGGEMDANARLRTAVVKAQANSTPLEIIERATKRGTGEIDSTDSKGVV